MKRSRIARIVLAAVAVTTAACSDSTGPEGVDLSGSWSGVATLPNGFTTTMVLQQSGETVTGTMSVAGSFRDAGIVGGVSGTALTWTVLDECAVWTGILNVSADGTEMTGPST